MDARWFVIPIVAGCGGSSPPCQVNGDCAAGQSCSAEHACVAFDAAPVPELGDAVAACAPNHDGQIDRDEVVILVPGSANFRTSGETAVDLVGTRDGDGTRHWDFSGVAAGDHDVEVTTAPLDGAWFAAQFPDGRFISPLSGANAQGLVAIYATTADKVQILGAASQDAGLTQTRLTYAPPVDAFVFPLHLGQHWEGRSTVTGTAQGVPGVFTDAWTQDVDASGELRTPYGVFPVLRIRLGLARSIGLLTTTTTTYAFVAECFGTVATVTSRSNEAVAEFTTAAQLQRLAP